MSRFANITLTPGDVDFLEAVVDFLEELLDQVEDEDDE